MYLRISASCIRKATPPNGQSWPLEQLRIIGAHQLGENWKSAVLNKKVKDRKLVAFVNFHSDPSISKEYTEVKRKRNPNKRKQKSKNKSSKKLKVMATSNGELKIIQWLSRNSIPFKRERSLGCVNPITKQKLMFDFFIPSMNVAIEFDGIQHFKHINEFHGKEESGKFESQKLRDRVKTAHCLKNGIRLIRIPYFRINSVDEILSRELVKVNIS